VLFGASGAGKTTILRALAGLEVLDEGRIVFREQVWADAARKIHLRPQQRPVGYLFQDYALFPHLDVRGNIGFGLHGLSGDERKKRVTEAARTFQVEELLERMPAEISGGQQQRVALARALVRKPGLLLLDEPLSALDVQTRDRVRGELSRLLRSLDIPAVLVSHDWIDALSLGDELVVMSRGTVLQSGSPQDVFARPRHAEVAAAVGMETLASGTVVGRETGSVRLRVGRAELTGADPQDGQTAYFVGIRGENVTLETGRAGQSSARNHLHGVVKDITPAGALWRVTVDVGFDLVALLTRPAIEDMRLRPGSEVFAAFKAAAVHLIPKP
jgi:molybdate transport system ATP-binding protein